MRKYLKIAAFLFMVYAIYILLFASNPLGYTVYYPNQDETHLVGIEGAENLEKKELYNYVMTLLIRGPEDDNLVNPIPQGVRLVPFGDDLGPTVIDEDEKMAMVNFSKELVENHPGGATKEKMTIAAIVNTLTSFRDIKKVGIYVEGELINTLTGDMELNQPLTEFSDLIK